MSSTTTITMTTETQQQQPQAPDLSKHPKLTREQAGHLRHFHNLVTQPDNDWDLMGSQEPLQEFLDAYRYQLATMAYAAGAAHFHRQPALRSVYKALLRQTIRKMLLRAVWAYWFNTSMAGIATDPDLKELRKPWADPVVRENIMYSGHLLMMVALYGMLFDDDEFERPGSLEFLWNPLFFGLGPEKFSYDAGSLQDAILKEMEGNGWIGVCCEPNMVFVVCNQFPLIGMRLRDARLGTSVVDDVLEKYKAAWDKKGLVGADGLLPDAWMVKQDFTIRPKDPAWTAWGSAFMNSWNGSVVRSHYEDQALGYITNTGGGEIRLNPPSVGNEFRKLVKEDSAAPDSRETLELAVRNAKEAEAGKKGGFPYTKPTFGYTVQWLSELGKDAELTALLKYADEKLGPKWERGGLYYPRNDEPFDEEMRWTHMDPFSGNAAIGYARLNVEDGQKIIWERPWTAQDVSTRPFVDAVTLADGVDFLRGDWSEEERMLVLTVRSWDGSTRTIKPVLRNLGPGTWNVFVDGQLRLSRTLPSGEDIALEVQVGHRDVDIVAVNQA
ncbi:hypothetical protein CNYM01_07846 [Colletotrichum nymphaeae SA-01]|uniref:Linalool dehydratase/isomerase domain-containing protein n=1 Tax=Colletotrichum nymphaeae SA-01 TaxID=1460502 RepID=A0A135UI17_9PEZI|nr:hypothetical protein CNYM01_07846 [Colletotrichum nymphaeae SA-01]